MKKRPAKLEPVLLRFSRGQGLAAAVVRAETWSWCAHVGFKLEDGHVLDSTPELGVAIREAKDHKGTRYYRVDAPAEVVHEALVWAKFQVGRPYDWRGALGIGFHRDWHDHHHWFCSELVAAAFEEAHHPLLRTGHLDRVTPADLLMSPYLIPLSAAGIVPPQGAKESFA